MITNRIKVSQEATNKMKLLKTRLKLEVFYPIVRMGLALSLNDKKPPQDEFYKENGMEFTRITLLGEYDPIYMCMLKEYGIYKKLKKEFAHMKLES